MEKLVTLFLVLFASILPAQDCSHIISKTDKYTGETSIELDTPYMVEIRDQGVLLVTPRQQPGYRNKYLILAATELNCVDDDDMVYFLFTDGTKLTISNDASFNCNGIFMVNLTLRTVGQPPTKTLWEKQLSGIRLQSSSSSIDFDLEDGEGKTILNFMKCFDQATK